MWTFNLTVGQRFPNEHVFKRVIFFIVPICSCKTHLFIEKKYKKQNINSSFRWVLQYLVYNIADQAATFSRYGESLTLTKRYF